MDPITKAYMSILNESVPSNEVKTDLKVGAPFGDKENEKNVNTFYKGSGPDEVEGLKDPEEAPDELTSDVDSSLKKLSGVKEAKNPFDVLFNKIVSEETFNFSTGEDQLAFGDSSSEDEDEDESDVNEFMDSEEENEEEEGEVTLTLDKELATKLMEILKAAVEGEEESEEESEESEEGEESEEESEEGEDEGDIQNEYGDEETNSDENKTYPESFVLDDAEKVNTDKAVKELTNPKNFTVNTALKAKSKKAETPAVGKKSDGKLHPHSSKSGVSKLQNKKFEVKDSSVKKDKVLFDTK